MDDALFDLPAGATRDPPRADDKRLSYITRLTARNNATLAAGRHPTGSPLHPQAAPADDRKAPGLRCRGCDHLVHQGGVAGSYLKCDIHLITRGPGTDIRSWWPACSQWKPREEEAAP